MGWSVQHLLLQQQQKGLCEQSGDKHIDVQIAFDAGHASCAWVGGLWAAGTHVRTAYRRALPYHGGSHEEGIDWEHGLVPCITRARFQDDAHFYNLMLDRFL